MASTSTATQTIQKRTRGGLESAGGAVGSGWEGLDIGAYTFFRVGLPMMPQGHTRRSRMRRPKAMPFFRLEDR